MPATATPVYPTRSARRRAAVSWCLFDFANSSYTTLIVTVVFAVFFREVVVGAEDNRGDWMWGWANFLAMAMVAVISPIAGAAADASGRKKLFLVLTTLQTVLATGLLYFASPGRVVFSVALYVIATTGFEAGYVFYNAFLPEVSTPRTIGRVSGWGWAVGFAGGLTALVLCRPLISRTLTDVGGRLDPTAVQDRQLSFLIVAVFYLVFALPAFLWLRSAPADRPGLPWFRYPADGLARVRQTIRRIREHREVAKFVLASLLYNDGITTVIVFSAIYARTTFGFDDGEIVTLFIAMNVIAFPTTALAGYLADRLGGKTALAASLVLWIAVVLLGVLAQSKAMFWTMAAGAAAGMGSTQAVGRSLMAQLSPPERQAEFFGFYVMSGKFAAIFGPPIFGTVSAWTGSQRLATLSILPFFVAGLLLLARVRPERAG